MANFPITSGVIPSPVKVVLYGPEGIGKTTFASRFPAPLFIDTEGGTKALDVRRLPPPENWGMLLDEVAAAAGTPCKTLVLDTADWAERLCIRAVCARGKVQGIEDFGYGKGYTYLKEEFAKLLDALERVVDTGRNVVVTAHAQLTKFEQPDEMGAYDRWSMKTSRQVAPLLREWCDMLLFANYKTFVVKDGTGKNAKGKAQGGQRVIYTTHHPCWDAKNRFGLADELQLDYTAIAPVIDAGTVPGSLPVQPSASTLQLQKCPDSERLFQQFHETGKISDLCPYLDSNSLCNKYKDPNTCPRLERSSPQPPAADANSPAVQPTPAPQPPTISSLDTALQALGVPDALRALMVRDGVSDTQLRHAVAQKGAYPEDMPIRDYHHDFSAKFLPEHWQELLTTIVQDSDIPF